ncbi:MAG TPA: hypothetical protein VIK18_11800 [Pirellulales bacterium]
MALCLCAAVVSAAAGQDTPKLLAGAAQRKVTPPTWVPYLTSSGAGTSRPFEGVHDDLYARAIVLDDGHRAIAVLAVDAIGYDNAVLGPGRDFTAELRRLVAQKTGLAPGAIMLAASHTHSAPETIGLSPVRDSGRFCHWLEEHLAALAQTVIEAWQGRTACEVRFGTSQVPGMARYRRIALKRGGTNRQGPLPAASEVAAPWQLDEQLSVLYLQTPQGRPLAALLNFTAHPVVAMLLPSISADYPGAATRTVEEALPGCVCLFTNGCAGNINSVAVSTSFDDVDRLGGQLGHAALKLIGSLRTQPSLKDPAVGFASQRCELEPRPAPTLEAARKQFDEKPSAANGRLYRLAAKLAEGPPMAEVQMMHVGPVRWLSLPGEPFVETGLALKQAGASFVVGYANGYLGYFPIRRAYDEGDYEVTPGVWSRVAPGSAERLEAAGKQLLSERMPP